MIRYCILLAFLMGSACSAYIEDFKVVPDGGRTDSTAGTDVENTPVGIIDCTYNVTLTDGNTLTFCAIQSGTFQMGCDPNEESCLSDEQPIHDVEISTFQIQQTEVTNSAYNAFVSENPEWAPEGDMATRYCDNGYLSTWDGDTPSGSMLQQPVLSICWYAANAFCQWLGDGYRLPYEAEWERVSRGTNAGLDSTTYQVYPFQELGCAFANYSGCENGPSNVGTHKGTAFGQVYDMGGNAWELVADWYREAYYCDPDDEGFSFPDSCNQSYDWKNPTGPESGENKVVRGGSWFHDPQWMRCARRNYVSPNFSSNITGFRCAADD